MPHVTIAPSTRTDRPSQLQLDLVAMLRASRAAECDLFAALDADTRDRPGTIGEWSAKDVQAHLAAWRGIEARRLEAAVGGDARAIGLDRDPAPGDPTDAANAVLHDARAGWSWQEVDAEANASVEALIDVIGRSTSEALCECNQMVAGIGANGANHAIGHLSDVAVLAGAAARYNVYAEEVEAILRHGHLPPRDSGVILYNIACHHALSGHLDEARRLLRSVFSRHREELLEVAKTDPDLAALSDELMNLAGRF